MVSTWTTGCQARGELLADSILGVALDLVLHVDAEIAYQVTHVLLFLYGFGSASRPPVESLRTEDGSSP